MSNTPERPGKGWEAKWAMSASLAAELELSTWRRAIADEMRELGEPLTWGTGDDTKAQALTLVTRLYGLSGITADEADAVLIGRAAQRLRLAIHAVPVDLRKKSAQRC